MDFEKQYEARWGIRPPEDYLAFYNSGLLVNDQAIGIRLSSFKWMGLNEIMTMRWPRYKIDGLIPFAETVGRDYFCWRLQGGESWVASCPRDSNSASGYSPNFESFIYRALLYELLHTSLPLMLDISFGDARDLMISYVDRSSMLLKVNWVETLRSFLTREPILTKGRIQTISPEEYREVVKQDISFPMLDKAFEQNVA